MTNRSTLEALLARVLKGSGPDRELDAEIALAFGIVAQRGGNCFYGHKHYSVMVLDRDYYDHDGNAPELPNFTASLDAALTLVPERWKVASLGESPERANSWTVWLRHRRDETELLGVMVNHAATPARALIAACIKARMEKLGE